MIEEPVNDQSVSTSIGETASPVSTAQPEQLHQEEPPIAMDSPPEVREVAISGSPNSTTNVSLDVRKAFLATPLLGSLMSFDITTKAYEGTEETLRVLGQVASLTTRNRWHEEPSLKNYIKLRGALPHLSTVGDFTSGELEILGAYVVDPESNRLDGSLKRFLPVPPGSGLPMSRVDATTIQEIMVHDFGYGYLGDFYGSPGVPAPVYVRHFGDYAEHGSGEAYMGGVFGPSGCGKTVIAASLIALWAQSPQLGILILDPQGEFSGDSIARGTPFEFHFFDILSRTSGKRFNSETDVLDIGRIQLEGASMFVEILREIGFFKTLGVSINLASSAAENVANWLESLQLENNPTWHCSMTWTEINAITFSEKKRATAKKKAQGADPLDGEGEAETVTFAQYFCREAVTAYAASGREGHCHDLESSWEAGGHHLQDIWDKSAAFFADHSEDGMTRIPLLDLLKGCVIGGKIKILDLNTERVEMDAQLKLYLMDLVFKKLRQISYMYYKSDKTGNCLIVLDEAGRFIPQDAGNNAMLQSLSRQLTDSVKELRKMRCGFMFITQTVTEIQKDIFRNLHYRVYGVGLGIGADADHIKAKEGDKAFELYRTLPDPRLSKVFSYMVCGTLVAIGSSGLPMFIQGFHDGPTLLEKNIHLLPVVPTPGTAGTPVTE